MCSAPLDLLSMLQKIPGNVDVTDAMKHLNIQQLGGNQSKATPKYGTLGKGVRGSVLPGSKINAPDPIKMYKEVS